MSFSFSNARLRWKLASLVAVTIVTVTALGALAGQMIHRQMVEDRKNELRSIVQGMSGIASTLSKEVAAGTLTREAALAQFGKTAQGFVYGENDYIFAYDRTGLTVAHANTKAIGTVRIDIPTANRYLVREMLEGAKPTGEVTIFYEFPRPNTTEPAPKMSYAKFHEGLGVLIGTGVYIDDIDAKFAEIRWALALTVLGVVVVGTVAAIIVGNSITAPLRRLEGRMRRIADGNLDEPVEEASRRDEIGAMARAVEVFKANAGEKERLETEHTAAAQRAEEEKRRTLRSMAERFERTVGDVIRSVSTETESMEREAQDMARAAERTDTLASAVATATEQTSANVQTVAAATEELTGSIGEIGRQVAEASRIAGEAVTLSERANGKVTGLAEAVEKIGAVVDLIHDIASQTNLLALNATIEAARAGDAGKGFAVVASEVKQLATQTAKATEEIGAQVASIQAATGEAVGEIRDVGQVIGRVNEISTRIASAVEEQGAATNEISRNVQQAAVGTQEVTHNIAGVTAAAQQSGKLAYKVLEASRQLANDAATLDREVGGFLSTLRAG